MNPAMTWEKFWSIIDRVRAKADMQDEASVKQFLYTELIKLPQDELLGFDCAFTNSFPKDTKLYKLMSTNPSEKRE